MKVTTFETIESQRQPDGLYSGLPNRVEESRKRSEANAVFDVMARLATVPASTQSVLETVEDDNMSDVSHVAKYQKRAGDENESTKVPVSLSQTKATAEDGMAKMLAAISGLSRYPWKISKVR